MHFVFTNKEPVIESTYTYSVYKFVIISLVFYSAMAGNIIPAIATTNAIIAAVIVMEGLKVLNGRIEECKQVSYTLNFDGTRGGEKCGEFLSFIYIFIQV